MNYIGSKFSLLPQIARVLDEYQVPTDGIALDIFAGTGAVAQFLKRRGYMVYANDWQSYSYTTCVALIEHNSMPRFKALIGSGEVRNDFETPAFSVIAHLNQLQGQRGLFYEAYCEGGVAGRMYYSKHNGLRIEAVRDQIEQWHSSDLISYNEAAWLVACLIESADKVANTASVYGAYLKRIKKTAQKSLLIHALSPIPSGYPETEHRSFCEDSRSLLERLGSKRLRLVYIDPPYNARQYNANYHILETIARWDLHSFTPKGITGLRPHTDRRSNYCSKVKVERAFDELFGKINADYVLFSYNNEGLVPKDSLESIFCSHFSDVKFHEVPYKRFRADIDGEKRVYKGDSTVEFLVIGKGNA